MRVSVSQGRSPPQRGPAKHSVHGSKKEAACDIGCARLGGEVTVHSIVRDGHRADCEAQTEGCRVMGVMEIDCG